MAVNKHLVAMVLGVGVVGLLGPPGVQADRSDPVAAERRLREQGPIDPLPDPGSGITRDIGAIAIVEHDGSTSFALREADGTPRYSPRAALAKRFYLTHADAYDFLVVFTNFEFNTGATLSAFNPIRNDVRGIGKPQFNMGDLFGSPGRLLGVVDMGAINRYRVSGRSVQPGDPGFLETLNVLAHQISHQWLADVRYRAGGQDSAALLAGSGHWAAGLDSSASVLYGAEWFDNGNGTFTARRVERTLSDLDLYLMGLVPSPQVSAFKRLASPALDPEQRLTAGHTIAATAETVTIDQVLQAEGARSPDHLRSPKNYRVGFVLLTERGRQPVAEDLEALENVRRAFAGHFFSLARGLALAETTLVDTPPSSPLPSPDLDKALAWLLSQQAADGRWEDSTATAIRDTASVLEALKRAGQIGAPFSQGLSWTRGVTPTNSDYVLRRAFGLAAGTLSASERTALLNEILARQNADGGFALAAGYESDPLDTALGLRSLRALGQSADSAVRRAIAALETQQLVPGGWSAVTGAEISPIVTAQVLLALQDWSALGDARLLASSALAALLGTRNPDGGFGQSPSTPYSTALALQALVRAGSPAALLDPPTAWLQRVQSPEGSWEQSRHHTALVLTALRASVAPNLIVSSDGLVLAPVSPNEGDIVRVTAEVHNVGRSPAAASRARLFDGDPATGDLIGEATVTALEAGGRAAVSFDYPTADRAGNRTLFVVADAADEVTESREDDNSASRAVRVQGKLPDLVVDADLTVEPNPPEEGETVQVRMRVRNIGEKAAPSSILRLISGDVGDGGLLLGQRTLGVLNAGAEAVVEVPWNTTGARGNHDLSAYVDSSFAVAESDETNNSAQAVVQVTGPIPPGPDLEIVTVALQPESLSAIPQDVKVDVLVRNRGRARAISDVVLYDGEPSDDTLLTRWSVDLSSRATARLSFTVRVVTSGDHVFTAVADPDNALDENDEDNNLGQATLADPNNTVDLEILATDVTLSPSELVIGDEVEATITVHNRGTLFSPTFPVILGLVDASGSVKELARSEQSLSENGEKTITLRWKTSTLGDPVVLAVWADPADAVSETSEGNNRTDVALTIGPSTRPNLTVSNDDLAIVPEAPLEAGTATLSVIVRNPSSVDAGPFVVRFFAGKPLEGGVAIGDAPVAGVEAASSATARLTWAPVHLRGAQEIVAVVDVTAAVDEYDETDNEASRILGVLGLPDLALNTAELTLDPAFPKTGETVTIRAVVRNHGDQESPATTVQAYEGPSAGAPVVATANVPALAPRASATVELSWTPAAPAGERLLSLVVDPDSAIREQAEGNNRARRMVVVQDSSLYLTHLYFSPNGDGINDETTFAYRVAEPAHVAILNERGTVVRTFPPGASGAQSVTWDGRDTQGRVVADGAYVLALQTEHGGTIGQVRAFVDTNRRTLFDAVGSGPLVTRRRACGRLGDLGYRSPAWMPAEDRVLFIDPDRHELVSFNLEGETTRIRVQGNLSRAYFPSPAAVSPDGRAVLVSTGALPDDSLFLVDLTTGEMTSLNTPGLGAWSPDGSLIATSNRVLRRDGSEFAELPEAGSWAWSPDGQFLASWNVVVRKDGTDRREIELPEDANDGNARTTIWRGDGKIYVEAWDHFDGGGTFSFEGGDGGRRRKVFAATLDPVSGATRALEWLTEDCLVGVTWSDDGQKVAYHNGDCGSEQEREIASFDAEGESPTFVANEDGSNRVRIFGSALTFGPRASAAVSTADECLTAVTSLQNLTAIFTAASLPDENGIQIKATVGDEHLQFYQLEYATQADPSRWTPLGPSADVPMNDEDMTIWVPPAPGTYFLRLTAGDRAGNVLRRTQRIVWQPKSLVLPAIADITQTEFVISPNGDGIKDSVTFDYRVLRPTTVDVRITGPKRRFSDDAPGLTIDELTLSHADVGAASFTWNRAGFPDGRYTVFINGLAFRLDLDVTPPEIGWTYGPAKTVVAEDGRSADLVAMRTWYVADPYLESWTASGSGTQVGGGNRIQGALTDSAGNIVFESGGAPAPARDNQGRVLPQTIPADKLVAWLGTSDDGRFAATDRAGNSISIPITPIPERLYLLEGWPSGCRPVLLPPIDSEGVHAFQPESSFHLAETIRGQGAEQVYFEYRADGGSGGFQRAGGATNGSGAFSVFMEFTKVGLEIGPKYRGRFATESGFASEEFRFFLFNPTECPRLVYLDIREDPSSPPADPENATFFLDLKSVGPEPIVIPNARASIVYEGQEGGNAQFIALDPDEPTRIEVRRPSCGAGVSFSAVLTAEQQKALEGACLSLGESVPQCPYSVGVAQAFPACSEASPGTLYLTVGGRSREAGTVVVRSATREIASVSVPAGGFSREVLGDTLGLPEGEIPVTASLEVAGHLVAQSPPGKIIVDRSPPIVSILTPADGAALCAREDPETRRELVAITVEAIDFGATTLLSREYRSGSTWLPWACDSALGGDADGLCPPVAFSSGRPQGIIWDVTGLESGDQSVRLTFCDRVGYKTTVERRFVFVKDPPQLVVANVSRPFFSPNSDGRADETRVRITSFQALSFTATVHRGTAEGEAVRSLMTGQTRPAGTNDFIWDGRDEAGAAVADGEYILVVVGRDGCDREAEARARLTVDTTPPTTQITSPIGGETVAATVDVRGTADDSAFADYELSYGVGVTPTEWIAVRTGSFAVVSGLLGQWTTPQAEGEYTLRLLARDAADNTHESRVSVQVAARLFLARLEVTPAIFSPNADDRSDTTTITYALETVGRVSLEIRDAADTVLRRLESNVVRDSGTLYSVVWDGLTDPPANVVVDGEYRVWVRVEDAGGGGLSQERAIAVIVDRTAPVVELVRPASGAAVGRNDTAWGSIEDEHLASYDISALSATGVRTELARGVQQRTDTDLAMLSGLADGSYTLIGFAEDAGGNRTTVEVPIIVDSVAPRVSIASPTVGSVLKRSEEPIVIRGAVVDGNLTEYVLTFGPGRNPAYYDELARGTAGGESLVLASWSIASLPEGDYTLKLTATDRAGQTSEVLRHVAIDLTAPVAAISAPADGAALNSAPTVQGMATDERLSEWQLESAAGPPTTPFPFSPVAFGEEEIEDGTFGTWTLPVDGVYTLRLTVRDHAGNTSSAHTTVSVDTVPPEGIPSGLEADVEASDAAPLQRQVRGLARLAAAASGGGAQVRLTWHPSGDPDVAGYRVYRDGEQLTPERLAASTFVDVDLPEGSVFRYSVSAEDRAGNQGLEATVTVRIDVTPPTADILQPTAGESVSGVVTVRGTAHSVDDFKSYRLYVSDGPGSVPISWTLLQSSSLPVVATTLGEWMVSGEGGRILALEAEDTSGNVSRVTIAVTIDTEAPARPVLRTVLEAPVATVTATWDPSPSTDVAGYLVYRNGQLVNATELVQGDLETYLVTGSSYEDAAVPDGRQCYSLAAMDNAKNVSALSDEVCVDLDNRDPVALIVEPAAGTRFDKPLRVAAASPDTDIVSVQFEIRAESSAGAWTPLGAADSTRPYEAMLDPAALALSVGNYELRAIAADADGPAADAPPTIAVRFADTVPPDAPRALVARVTGGEVELSWEPRTEADFGEYRIYRNGERIADSSDASFTDVVGVGTHEYAVDAVDTEGNESAVSNRVTAVVYAVTLDFRYPVTEQTEVTLKGSGARAQDKLQILRDDVAIAETTGADGNFEVTAVPLVNGGNILKARGTDGASNTSIPSEDLVLISNARPPATTGLAATVTDHDVELSWTAVDDAELHGYRVRRDGELRTGSSPATSFDAQGWPTYTGLVYVPSFHEHTFYGSNAVDGNPTTAWIHGNVSGTVAWVATFPSAILVDRVDLQFAAIQWYSPNAFPSVVANYRIEALWTDRFLPLVTVRGNAQVSVSHTFPSPFQTTAIRVVLEAYPYQGLSEVSISKLDLVPAGTTTFREASVPDGRHRYEVEAVDRYGSSGAPASAEAAVGDVTAPAPPTGLAASVSASDVVLTWNASSEPDLVHYAIVRDGVAVATSTEATYRDAGRRNGTYRYTVRAVDSRSNPSLDSAPADALVNVAPPDAPVLRGSAAPDGSVLLEWDHAGAVGFQIDRSTIAGGPYEPRGQSANVRSFIDAAVVRTETYHYVVRAVDAVGNASVASNEASVTPKRTTLPSAPVIYFPSDAAHPVTLQTTQTDVHGRTEAGLEVALEVNGEERGRVSVMPPLSAQFTVPREHYEFDVSPDGKSLAFGSPGAEIVVLQNGSRRAFRDDQYHRLASPQFSPDGGRISYVAHRPGEQHLFIVDRATGQRTAVDIDPVRVDRAEWSPDGSRIVYTRYQSGWVRQAVLRDLAAETTVLLPIDATGINEIAWSPDGTRLAYRVGASPDQIRLLELATGADSLVDFGTDAPSWSADGRYLAYRRQADVARVAIRDMTTGQVVTLPQGIYSYGPRFDRAGHRLALQLVAVDPATGQSRAHLAIRDLDASEDLHFVQPGGGSTAEPDTAATWTTDGMLVFGSNERIVYAPTFPAFSFPQVALAPGQNLLVAKAVIVPEEIAGPPSDAVSVTVPEDRFADLVVSAVATNPAAPIVGQRTMLSADVRNGGGVSAPDFPVILTVRSAAGVNVFRTTARLVAFEAGARLVVSAQWTPTTAGTYSVSVHADDANVIVESREDNNEARRVLTVATGLGLNVSVISDRATYPARTESLIRVRLVQGGSQAYEGTVDTLVEDAAGRLVARVDTRAVSFRQGEATEFVARWNTGTTYAGDYRIRAIATEHASSVASEALLLFRILPDVAVTARVIPEHTVVARGATAAFAARVENRGANAPLNAFFARLRLIADGQTAPAFETQAGLPSVLPGGLWEGTLTWPNATPVGRYRVLLDVLASGEPAVASHETLITISDGDAVAGRLRLVPADVLAGDELNAEATLTNRSLVALSVPVVLETTVGATGVAVRQESLSVALGAGESLTIPVRLTTNELTPNLGYVVVLKAGTPSVTLDAATLKVHGQIVPPSVHAPAAGAHVTTATPSLAVNNGGATDGADLTYEFQVFGDAALVQPITAVRDVAETTLHTAWTVSVGLQEDVTYYWRARAADGFSVSAWMVPVAFTVDAENFVPLAPVPDTPAPGQHVASNQPTLSVVNATDQEFDALTYEFRLATDPQMTMVVASTSNVAEGVGVTAWPAPVVLAENTTYYWSARARDGAGEDRASPWSAPAAFTVDTVDESPSAPTPLRPVGGVAVPTLTPELVVLNASDPEGISLTYRFEIDTSVSFNSPVLQFSSELPESPGETSWRPAALTDNTVYYWRARARDGHTSSPWAGGSFFVNLSNDAPSAPMPLDPVDCRAVPTSTPTLQVNNSTDADRDALTYEFEVRDSADTIIVSVADVLEGSGTTIWAVSSPLAEDGTFKWRARAFDGTVRSPWSAAACFRVNAELQPPTAPQLESPADHAVVAIRRPTLAVRNAVSPEALPLTYDFELYRNGVTTAIETITSVPEGVDGRAAWTPVNDLTDGHYNWRARAFDGVRYGPWMASAHFEVQVDLRPAPPTGLRAVPGDQRITLTWNPSPEPDVVKYRVYRSAGSGGPYSFLAETTTPSFLHTGLPNGTAVYYVVTALDARFESEHSTEAGATPSAPTALPAQIAFNPSALSGGCAMLNQGAHHDTHGNAHRKNDDDDGDNNNCCNDDCPQWIKATIELPHGVPPSSIVRTTIRLAGAVSPDAAYHAIVDRDGDGIQELEVRFARMRVTPLLVTGPNSLAITGQTGSATFQGLGLLQLQPIVIELRFTPRTLNRGSHGSEVQGELTFCDDIELDEVVIDTIRLNDMVPVTRVVSSHGHTLTVKFNRSAVLAVLPNGNSVEVRVTGVVGGRGFRGVDHIKVMH